MSLYDCVSCELEQVALFFFFQKHLALPSQVHSVVACFGAMVGAFLWVFVRDWWHSVDGATLSGEHIESFLNDTAEERERAYVCLLYVRHHWMQRWHGRGWDL